MPKVTEQLMKEAKIESMQEWQNYVTVFFTEVKTKEVIVRNKHNCTNVGFVDLGSINIHFKLLKNLSVVN